LNAGAIKATWRQFEISSEANSIAHPLEQKLARGLRGACADVSIGSDISRPDRFGDVTDALEFYLPELLQEVHAGWKREYLDGLFHEFAIKTAECEAELAVLCFGPCVEKAPGGLMVCTADSARTNQAAVRMAPLQGASAGVALACGESTTFVLELA